MPRPKGTMADGVLGARERIDAIEEGYEYFLAYAAQGLRADAGAKAGGEMRSHLARIILSVDGLGEALGRAVRDGGRREEAWDDVLAVVAKDAQATLAALRLVAAQPAVSSQLIDNLNANVHFRALLTGLFLVDEALAPVTPPRNPEEPQP